MSLAPSTAAPRTAWIVSPLWDLAYLVATPLVIVPTVLILARYWFTPEQITLVVISFASMGHHLPGFMRAYGDRELFVRFRWRFLVMPVLIFALALLFSPPSWLAGPLRLSWQHLHGLELILLLWGTWHGLMQTYGFMRIYDLKRRPGNRHNRPPGALRDRWTARLDHWLCLAIFGCGYLFSDARMYGTAEVMWQIGLPVFDRQHLEALRTAAGVLSLVVLALYVANLWRQERLRAQIGSGASWAKILLAASTGWIYWYTGRLSTNLIIGLAMFEIYHAIQYYAIVWHYNRRIVERDGSRFGWLAFLFQDKWTMLGLYLALVAAFGSIRFFTVDTADYVFRGGELDVHKLLIAFLVTSTFLHYYFDGFIWKVSEGRTQRNLLGSEGEVPNRPTPLVPALVHAGKWSIFFAAAGVFLFLETKGGGTAEGRSYVKELAELTPDLPELQIQVSRDALDQGDVDLAVRAARSALAMRPRSHSAHGDLAVALLAAGQQQEAVEHLQAAIALEPRQWRYHTNLGIAYDELGLSHDAERAFRSAVALAPSDAMPYRRFATWLVQQGQAAEAAELFARACAHGGNRFELRLLQIEALIQADRSSEALTLATQLVQKRPDSADAHVSLGAALLADGRFAPAARALRRAVELNPEHVGGWFELGAALHADEELDAAQAAYDRVLQLAPDHAEATANLGAVLLSRGALGESESRLRQALALRPNLASARLNLGVCLLRQGWKDSAAEQFRQALAAGQPVPGELLHEVGIAADDR